MALWIVHLRIADLLLKKFPGLCVRDFIYGNIAPDSGVPVPGNYVFSPPKEISHFYYKDGFYNLCGFKEFRNRYLLPDKTKQYSREALSFYLGYFCHLVTDWHWSKEIVQPIVNSDREAYEKDKAAHAAVWKKDFYAIDCRFLKENPDFEAFKILCEDKTFENIYFEFFPKNAFDLAREKIKTFYSSFETAPKCSEVYMTKSRADRFVTDISSETSNYLNEYPLVIANNR